MSDHCNVVAKVYIKVYQGGVLKKAPPRERYVQIMPNGQPGTVFKGRVYPLYQGNRINLLDTGALSTDCYQAPNNESTGYLMENLPVFPYGWLEEQGMKLKFQPNSALLEFNGATEFKASLILQLSSDFHVRTMERTSDYQWSLFLKPTSNIEASELEPLLVTLISPLVKASQPESSNPEILKRQLAEAQAEITSLRKELLAARQRIMQLSMSNPQPR